LNGCAPAFQGIKFRAQSPNIDEAFRKITLALTTDGYTLAAVDPVSHTTESGWRTLTVKELSEADRSSGADSIEGRITVRLEVRGKLYDVFVTPEVRLTTGGKTGPGTIAGVRHPLREKWVTVLSRLVEREFKEED
jgi:hypothetical protein